MPADDLAPLLRRKPPPGVGFRQGVILTWDTTNASNTVQVDGQMLTDLPILNTSEALLLTAGSVVGLLTSGGSWWILGRITVPGTADAVATLGSGIQVASVGANFGPLTNDVLALNSGPEITTTILSTGRAYVTGASGMDLDLGDGADLRIVGSGPSGETWVSDSRLLGDNFLSGTSVGGTISISASTSYMATGLTPGVWTFGLHSRRLHGSGGPLVWGRVLTVTPT